MLAFGKTFHFSIFKFQDFRLKRAERVLVIFKLNVIYLLNFIYL